MQTTASLISLIVNYRRILAVSNIYVNKLMKWKKKKWIKQLYKVSPLVIKYKKM